MSESLKKLEYYQAKEARRTMIARVILLSVIIGMLGLNMWLTQRNYDALVINMNQARLDQDQFHEFTTIRLKGVEEQLDLLQTAIDMEHANTAEVAAQ